VTRAARLGPRGFEGTVEPRTLSAWFANRVTPAGRSRVRGPSRVVDPGAFRWSDEAWQGVAQWVVTGDPASYQSNDGPLGLSTCPRQQ